MTDIALLIKKFLKDELDERETQELDFWKSQSDLNRQIFEELTNDAYLIEAVGDAYKIDSDTVARQKMHELIAVEQEVKTGTQKPKIRSLWFRLAATAAVIFILISITIIYILRKDKEAGSIVATQNAKPDIAPGGTKATLTLADGSTIMLDSAAMGQLAQQGATQIIINKDGQLVYAEGKREGNSAVFYNKVSTSKGQTYPLLLSDHSRVWLNAESSIRFPVSFTGNERRVEITGEVYFEIAHDAAKPFFATVNGVNIQVLGTKFNINAYADESAVKTTLIEGSVSISKGVQRKRLVPGQQAQVVANEISIVDNVDVGKITAWRQGYFRFKEDKLSEAMKNIARWYNIEVVFEGNAASIELSGDINRSSNLSSIVRLLAAMDVEARIEGRKLIVKAQ